MENETRMTEGTELESAAKEYRIVLRKDAVVKDVTDLDELRDEDHEPSDEDIMWSGELEALDALGLWEAAGLVPTVAKDMYELQERDKNDTWQFVALFGNEEDLEESLKEALDPPSVLIGEDGE